MRWREVVTPVLMTRVALVSPTWALRDMLIQVADEGCVEIERVHASSDLPVSAATAALRRLAQPAPVVPALSRTADIAELERLGRADLLAGEAEVAEYQAQAVIRGEVAALAGWAPNAAMAALARRLDPIGAAAVRLPRPPGVDPPTAIGAGPARRAFAPLVSTYATVPYADVDPTVVAGLAYVVTFGAMFGDVGQGLLLVLGAILIRAGRLRRLSSLRPHWIFVAGAGASATVFGFAYGEFFGPTGVVPVGLIEPMSQPVRMLIAGVALGALLLAGAYALGIVNRVREGGWALAIYAPSGVAGTLLFIAVGVGFGSWYWHSAAAGIVAVSLAAVGLVLAYLGLFVAAGGGAGGAVQATVELFDLTIRLGANIISFARLAAFGLTHAVLGWIVWQATTGLWGLGVVGAVTAVAVFMVGTTLAFALEALVAAVQALRLEYYELFSRVFRSEGRPFRPWRLTLTG